MKICFLMDSIYILGGSQKCTIDLANELSKNNEVTILCTKNVKNENKINHLINSKVKVKTIELHNKINTALTIWTKLLIKVNQETNLIKSKKILNYIYYTKNWNLKKIQKYIDDNNFDIVIGVAATHTMLLSQLKKVNKKFIGWQHSNTKRYFNLKNQFLWHQDKIFEEALEKLDYYVVLTENDKKILKKYFNYDAICIYNPCSYDVKSINYDREKIVLSVGRYDKVKGYDMLIKAYKMFIDNEKYSKYKLYIVGEGPERKNLTSLIDELELQNKVILTGLSNDVKSYYLKSDFLVLSSIEEGFPMVLLEAMECGLPIVSFDLPCIKEILNENFSYIAKYKNIEDLSTGMQKMSEMDLKDLRNKARENVGKFKINKIIKEWYVLFKK